MRAARITLPAVVCDVLLLVVFAALGRASHDEAHGNALIEAGVIASPFIAGWLVAASLFGALSPDTIRNRSPTFRRIPPAWLVGGCIGLILRSLVQHRPTPPAFVAIALGFNLITLTAWRLALSSITARFHWA